MRTSFLPLRLEAGYSLWGTDRLSAGVNAGEGLSVPQKGGKGRNIPTARHCPPGRVRGIGKERR